jgi:anti-sigma factor RsiW
MMLYQDKSAHLHAQASLPWLLNGTLAEAERQAVETHLHACPDCRSDLEGLRLLREAGAASGPGCDPERALARLLPRLDSRAAAPVHATPGPAPAARPRAANDPAWLRWAALAQACVIVLLVSVVAALLAQPDEAGTNYRALGAASAAQGQAVLMFKPDTPERELRRIVRASGARIVDGPTVTDAYVVGIDAGQVAPVLARLRAEPAVLLAEPLSAAERP